MTQEDLYYPHPLLQDLIWDSLYLFTEPLLTRWPFNKLVREKALQVTMKHIHYEDETSRYITIGCVEKVGVIFITVIKHIHYLAYIYIYASTEVKLTSIFSGFMYACLLGGRSKWRCFQEASCKGPGLLMGFGRWNDHAGTSSYFNTNTN